MHQEPGTSKYRPWENQRLHNLHPNPHPRQGVLSEDIHQSQNLRPHTFESQAIFLSDPWRGCHPQFIMIMVHHWFIDGSRLQWTVGCAQTDFRTQWTLKYWTPEIMRFWDLEANDQPGLWEWHLSRMPLTRLTRFWKKSTFCRSPDLIGGKWVENPMEIQHHCSKYMATGPDPRILVTKMADKWCKWMFIQKIINIYIYIWYFIGIDPSPSPFTVALLLVLWTHQGCAFARFASPSRPHLQWCGPCGAVEFGDSVGIGMIGQHKWTRVVSGWWMGGLKFKA